MTHLACNFQTVTISLMVPAVLSLHNNVVTMIESGKHLRKLTTKLRDSLKARFLGVFTRCNMAASISPDDPFSNKLFITATILDPNLKLGWIDVEIVGDADEDVDDTSERRVGLIHAIQGTEINLYIQ